MDALWTEAPQIFHTIGEPAEEGVEEPLLLETLDYADEVELEVDLAKVKIDDRELDMAFKLIDLLRKRSSPRSTTTGTTNPPGLSAAPGDSAHRRSRPIPI